MISSTFPRQLFITGTDTDIGKTVVSAILVAGLNAHYWKPVQSGLEGATDTEWIAENTNMPASCIHKESYRLKAPLSPHASAAREHIQIELDAFCLPEIINSDYLMVEGAGGIMVPLNDRHFMIDLMKYLNLPVLLVASSQLGTINHTLLSLEQLRRYHLDILGVVMNGPKNRSNKEAIETYGNIAVLAEIEPLPEISPEILKECFYQKFG